MDGWLAGWLDGWLAGWLDTKPREEGTDKSRSVATANLCTKILDFRGFDPSGILTSTGGIPRPMKFPKSLSQAILVGIILVGRLGVDLSWKMQIGACRSIFDL